MNQRWTGAILAVHRWLEVAPLDRGGSETAVEVVVALALLNASYEPLRVVDWKKALTLVFLNKVEVIEEYPREVRSISLTVKVPAVVRLLEFIRRIPRLKAQFSRAGVFARDQNTCQYDGREHRLSDLTLDHVLPRSMGGRSSWECGNLLQRVQSQERRPHAGASEHETHSPRVPPHRPRNAGLFHRNEDRSGQLAALPDTIACHAAGGIAKLVKKQKAGATGRRQDYLDNPELSQLLDNISGVFLVACIVDAIVYLLRLAGAFPHPFEHLIGISCWAAFVMLALIRSYSEFNQGPFPDSQRFIPVS